MPLPGLIAHPAARERIGYSIDGENTSDNRSTYPFSYAAGGGTGYTLTSDRLTVALVVIENAGGTTRTVTSVTIDGNNFTEIGQTTRGAGLDASVSMWVIRGNYTDKNIVVNCSGTANAASLTVIRLSNVENDTATSTDTGSGNAASLTSTSGKPTDVGNGIWLLGMATDDSGDSLAPSSGTAIEIYDLAVASTFRLGLYLERNDDDITIDFSGGADDYAFVRAAWD